MYNWELLIYLHGIHCSLTRHYYPIKQETFLYKTWIKMTLKMTDAKTAHNQIPSNRRSEMRVDGCSQTKMKEVVEFISSRTEVQGSCHTASR